MKKLIYLVSLSTSILFSAVASAQDIPFVGERYFSISYFHVEKKKKIDALGNTSIKTCGNAGCSWNYRGKHKTLIPLGDGIYAKLTSSRIYFTNSKGKLLDDCNAGNIYKKGCVTSYY